MSEATVVKMWGHLVESRPRLKEILRALENEDKTLYELQKEFSGSGSVHKVLQEMVEMGVIRVAKEAELPNGLTKKWYGVTELGRKLVKE